MMNGKTSSGSVSPKTPMQIVRHIDVERITTIREVIPVNAEHPQEAFDAAAESGAVLTSETTVEYIIRNYPNVD